jgi:hypothetical protein
MSIVCNTTTITVLQPTTTQMDGEAFQALPPEDYEEVATGVRAVIGMAKGNEKADGGEQTDASFRFHCDPTPIDHYSWIRDDRTGETFSVVWCYDRNAFGVTFTHGQLKRVEGLV